MRVGGGISDVGAIDTARDAATVVVVIQRVVDEGWHAQRIRPHDCNAICWVGGVVAEPAHGFAQATCGNERRNCEWW